MARSVRHRRKEAPTRRVTVRIDEIGAAGDGVAIADGEKFFVPLTAPGDVATIDSRGERGVLVDLIEESPLRSPPPCPHYGECGGCALQHLTRDFYRRWKRERIVGALRREDFGDVDVRETIETPVASRRRAVFAVRKKKGVAVGFNARRSDRIIDVPDCIVLHPNLAARLPALKALAGTVPVRTFDLSVTLCDNGLDIDVLAKAEPPQGAALASVIAAAKEAGAVRLSFGEEPIVTFASPVVRFDGIPVSPPPGVFLQASREGEAALIALVKAAAEGAKKIADLFSGCGTFALPLAKAATVSAFDSDRAAVAALAKAAGDAQREGLIHPLRTDGRDLFERPLTAKELKAFDAVVFDPPRAGAAVQAAELAASAVPCVVGVSCNPASFARDAAILARGGYALSQVTPVDQFVYSSHIELVGVFRKS